MGNPVGYNVDFTFQGYKYYVIIDKFEFENIDEGEISTVIRLLDKNFDEIELEEESELYRKAQLIVADHVNTIFKNLLDTMKKK